MVSSSKTNIQPQLGWLARNWILILALIPVIRIAMLSSADGDFSVMQNAARIAWLPTLFLEIVVFVLAVLNGLNLGQMIGRMSRLWKVVLGMWLVAMVIATVQAGDLLGHAIRGAIFWTIHLLFFVSVGHLLAKGAALPGNMSRFALAIPLSAAFSGLCIMVFAYITGLDSGFNWLEHLPGFAHIRHTGYIFAPAIAVSIAHVATRSDRTNRIHYILIAANTAFVLWLGSRGPVFGLLGGFAVCALAFSEIRSFRLIRNLAAATGIGAILSVIIPAPATPLFGAIQRFWNGQADPGSFSSGRTDFWLESLSLIAERPLFGYGAHTFQFLGETAKGFSKHPHQSLLQFIFDWGLIGGGAFLCMIGLLIFKAYVKNGSPNNVKLTSALVVSTLLSFSLIDGIYFYSYTTALSIVFLLWPIVMDQAGAKRAKPNS